MFYFLLVSWSVSLVHEVSTPTHLGYFLKKKQIEVGKKSVGVTRSSAF